MESELGSKGGRRAQGRQGGVREVGSRRSEGGGAGGHRKYGAVGRGCAVVWYRP